MSKEVEDLRRFRDELQAQDKVLQETGNLGVPVIASYPLLSLFDRIDNAFPDLNVLSFKASGQAVALVDLRSQIAAAIAAIERHIEDWKHINHLRAPLKKAEELIIHCISGGSTLDMGGTYGASDDADSLKQGRDEWIDETHRNLRKIFDSDLHAQRFVKIFNPSTITGASSRDAVFRGRDSSYGDLQATIRSGINYLESIKIDLYLFGEATESSPQRGTKIFFGHGRSPVWRELKDYVVELGVKDWEEFNREPAPGRTTVERLKEMLKAASFAFIVMTAEDGQPGGELRARQNVVHEAGLFQGRLGFERAIPVVEEGCSVFSNIDGLNVIRFGKGSIQDAFGEVQRTLKHAKIIR